MTLTNNYSHFPSTFVDDGDTTLAIAGLSVKSLPAQRYLEPETTAVWDTPFALLDMPATVSLADDIIRARKPEYFVTANLNYLMLIERYPQLAEVNRRAAAVLADGNPIVMRSRFGVSPLPCRVAGSDLILELAKLSGERGYSMFLLGAADGVAAKAAAELRARYPKLQIVGTYSPPFRALNLAEQDEMVAQINRSEADILLVAFGQPKGELWIYENLSKLTVPLSIQLGASFDFLAGTAKRAPHAWQRLGLEWMYRAACDPKRLMPRYSANILFLMRKLIGDLSWLVR